MKIVIFEIKSHETGAFKGLESHHHLVFIESPIRAENAAQFGDAEVISAFINSELDREVLHAMPSLKMIATRSTGFDHIDMATCIERGIVVSNVPTYGENTVAEHVFALLLSISHRMMEAVERARSGRFTPEGIQGFDLKGKTLGVFGTGSIGRHVIRIAHGFEMDVIACDIRPNHALAQELGFRYAPFEQVLAIADVVTLHVPATSETYNLLSEQQFGLMKDGAVLINTARGSLVDPHALIMALRSGKIAAAGLDVLADEPLIREEAELLCPIISENHDLRNIVADHVLLHMPNVVVTPHSGFNTREAMLRMSETTFENIEGFLDGHPRNVVTSQPHA